MAMGAGQLRDEMAALQEESGIFLPVIAERSLELGLPDDVPPQDERAHLAFMMAMMGLHRPDPEFFSGFDDAHRVGGHVQFLRSRMQDRALLVPDRQLPELTMMQSAALFGLGPGWRCLPTRGSSAVRVQGNRTTPREIGDREYINFGENAGSLPGGKEAAEARQLLRHAREGAIIGGARSALLELTQRICQMISVAASASGSYDAMILNTSLQSRERLDALARLWHLMVFRDGDGLDLEQESAVIRQAFESTSSLAAIGVNE